MNRVIFKYPIDVATMSAQHSIPPDSQFLDLQVQGGKPMMWWAIPALAPIIRERVSANRALGNTMEVSERKAVEHFAKTIDRETIVTLLPRNWKLRNFVVAPTGAPGYVDGMFYVGTFQLDGGAFVGHLMSHEEIPRP